MKEAIQGAFSYLQTHKAELGIARDFDTPAAQVEVIDLLNRVAPELGSRSSSQPAPPYDGSSARSSPSRTSATSLDVSADTLEQVDPTFYGDPRAAVMKVLGGP